MGSVYVMFGYDQRKTSLLFLQCVYGVIAARLRMALSLSQSVSVKLCFDITSAQSLKLCFKIKIVIQDII